MLDPDAPDAAGASGRTAVQFQDTAAKSHWTWRGVFTSCIDISLYTLT